ncbi:hypothetical protein [Agathobaculum butyriciproducens]
MFQYGMIRSATPQVRRTVAVTRKPATTYTYDAAGNLLTETSRLAA